MRLSFTEMAIAQKMDFHSFVDEWLVKHDILLDEQQMVIGWAIEETGWSFFINELIEYYQSRPDLYKVYDDTVELLEY